MQNNQHNDLEEEILKTLLYFDIFDYPLTSGEILQFLRIKKTSPHEIDDCLKILIDRKHVFQFGNFYSLHPDEQNISRRVKGNIEAQKWLKIAEEKAKFISGFPFVLAVMASGSLSKGYMDAKSDLDFFIVTAPGRLWIARTCLVMYKRIFLGNSHKQFCVNYFMDAGHLEIEEKNLFTATELITLLPLFNYRGYEAVVDSNQWVRGFFPNFKVKVKAEKEPQPSLLRSAFEILLLPFTGWLDKFFMQISLQRWVRLYGSSYAKGDFDIAFKTRRHVSKNHPNNYQKKVLERYQLKLTEFQKHFAHQPTYD